MTQASRLCLALLLPLTASACHGPALTPTRPPASRPPQPATNGTPLAGGAVKPVAASQAPAQTPSTAAALLAPLPGASTRLAGSVVLDASYMAATEAGTAIALGARSVLAAGRDLAIVDSNGVVSKTRFTQADGSTVVSKTRLLNPDGTPVVSKTRILGPNGEEIRAEAHLLDQAGQPIALAQGNLIGDQGGALIGDQGGSLISNGGAGLISNGGAGLISNAGGGLTGKVKYRLADASEGGVQVLSGERGPGFGTLLPAAGMRVAVRSLRTGQLLPIGQDPSGKPVYSIYTNLSGGYEFHLPPEEAGNVMVLAEVPQVADARTRYGLLTPVQAQDAAVVDEDTALMTRFVREVFAARLAAVLTTPPAQITCLFQTGDGLPAPLVTPLTQMIEEIHGAGQAAGVTADPARATAVAVLAHRMADTVLAPIDLAGIVIPTPAVEGKTSPNTSGRPALTVLLEVLKEGRTAATSKLEAQPTLFDELPFFRAANACEPGRYSIRKAADVGAFLLAEYIANNSDPGLLRASEVFAAIGMPTAEFGHAYASSRLTRAMDAILMRLLLSYNGNKEAVRQVIAGYDAAAPAPVFELPLTFRSPCPRPTASGTLSPCR
ncbi:MAG: hypothetical protein VKP62_09625 [Candidatus Sericytochromatia bacterium]|nr:hypothetical protein [Candidatus Sericytochromatia bacterium]